MKRCIGSIWRSVVDRGENLHHAAFEASFDLMRKLSNWAARSSAEVLVLADACALSATLLCLSCRASS